MSAPLPLYFEYAARQPDHHVVSNLATLTQDGHGGTGTAAAGQSLADATLPHACAHETIAALLHHLDVDAARKQVSARSAAGGAPAARCSTQATRPGHHST